MLGMTWTINALVRDNLAEGSSADEQLGFMQDKCAQAADLLGLHKKARQVQPRDYIAGRQQKGHVYRPGSQKSTEAAADRVP